MAQSSGNGNDRRLMRIGDLAKKAGTTMRTIRYYEQIGLINPATRTQGGFRLYQENELRKLRIIKALQLVDTPLSQIKALVDTRRRGRMAWEIAGGVSALLEQQLREVNERIAQFRAMEASLQETIHILRCCTECSLEPGPDVCPRCPVILSRSEIPVHMRAVIELGQQERESLDGLLAAASAVQGPLESD